jgi:hypothetical protein
MCDRCGCDGNETPCDSCSFIEARSKQFASWDRKNLEELAAEMLSALLRAVAWVEIDEQTHGRPFGTGNELREVIAKASSR